jgi:hypothetical protein
MHFEQAAPASSSSLFPSTPHKTFRSSRNFLTVHAQCTPRDCFPDTTATTCATVESAVSHLLIDLQVKKSYAASVVHGLGLYPCLAFYQHRIGHPCLSELLRHVLYANFVFSARYACRTLLCATAQI